MFHQKGDQELRFLARERTATGGRGTHEWYVAAGLGSFLQWAAKALTEQAPRPTTHSDKKHTARVLSLLFVRVLPQQAAEVSE